MAKAETRTKKRSRRVAVVDVDDCSGCRACVDVCPRDCLRWEDGFESGYFSKTVDVDVDGCVGCKFCEQICIKNAITVVERKEDEDNESSPTDCGEAGGT